MLTKPHSIILRALTKPFTFAFASTNVALMTALPASADNQDLWNKSDSTSITCKDFDAFSTPEGVLTNNVWNKHAAEDDAWSQCLEKRRLGEQIQYGWSWSWPMNRRVIYSQPQIKIGASPWAPTPKFDNSFPLEIAELKKLTIEHSLEINTNGDHNIATTLWLISEPYTGNSPKPSIIVAEIMIWTYATQGHFSPAGKKQAEVRIGTGIWEVWYHKDWDDKSGVNENRWINVTFRAKNDSKSATIPALKLLEHAIDSDFISDNLYIADIELGNEIMSGSGNAWVKKFTVDYR